MAVWEDEAEVGLFRACLRESDDRIVIEVSGELDVATASALHACFDGLGANLTDQLVVADLKGLTFCDSTGISAILSEAKRVRSKGGAFSVINCQPLVERTLEMTGTLDFLTRGL